MFADRDGVILLERSAAKDVIAAAAEAKMATEGQMVRAIRAGVDPRGVHEVACSDVRSLLLSRRLHARVRADG